MCYRKNVLRIPYCLLYAIASLVLAEASSLLTGPVFADGDVLIDELPKVSLLTH